MRQETRPSGKEMRLRTSQWQRGRTALCLLGVVLGLIAAAPHLAAGEAQAGASEEPILIDDFSTIEAWSAHPADGVGLALARDEVDGNPALRFDVHFEGGGYAIARRELSLPLPENYAFSFRLRGECPPNHLELKLVDGSNENVWWHVLRDVRFPESYRAVRVKKRKIQFAWGPAGGGEIDTVRAIEFAITAGGGGTGTVWIDDLTLVPLPTTDDTPPEIKASASSNESGVRAALDGDSATAWRSDSGDHRPWLRLDLGRAYEFSGVVLEWGDAVPLKYVIELSDDGVAWTNACAVEMSDGGRDPLFLPDSEARFVRIAAGDSLGDSPGDSLQIRGAPGPVPGAMAMSIQDVAIAPLDSFPDREAFFRGIARGARRGLYPRGIYGEQSYWTVVGLDRDDQEVLVGEDGAVELWAGGPSIEPFLRLGDDLITWADVQTEATLHDGYLPIPTVRWMVRRMESAEVENHLSLEVTALADGATEDAFVLVRYRIRNLGDAPAEGELLLTLRPFQVNPPSQSLNLAGGTARLSQLDVTPGGARVGERTTLQVRPKADRAGATTFAGGDIVADHLATGRLPQTPRVTDDFGAASAAHVFAFDLESGEQHEVVVQFSLEERGGARVPQGDVADFEDALRRVESEWSRRLDRVEFTLPDAAQRHLDTMKSQVGFILVNRSGPSIQPGVRSYARSWIRDGALTSSALLRLGHTQAAVEFLEWFAPHQYQNGKIPCVVDHRGADPVPEHDSSGEFIFLVAEIFRFTGDSAFAERHWPRVLAATGYLDSLRHERLDPRYQTGEQRHFYGILPPSISHEGYSAKPMHSYWDDFFALKGFKDAVFLARELKKPEAVRLDAITTAFARDLAASIEAAQSVHGIDYVPGCADLGDFDATSTTIAITPVGVDGVVPPIDLERTFRRYLAFTRDREETADWDAYTPYELRNVGVFVRLGWRNEAHKLLDFFFGDQRPSGWRSWAEVVAREEREPRFLGDIPHTWVGSDYIRSFLDMFFASDPDGRYALIGAGVPLTWLDGEGVSIKGLPTRFGAANLRMIRTGERELSMEIDGMLETPPQGWIIRPPLASPPREIVVNGNAVELSNEVRVLSTPARVRISW